MPPRKFNKTKSNKKLYKKSYRKRSNQTVKMRSKTHKASDGAFSLLNRVDPFPLIYRCKFNYTSNYVLTAAATQRISGVAQEYRLNSAYDPDYTSVGAIPSNTRCYGFNELLGISGPYTRYKVYAVQVDILFNNPSQGGVVGIAHIKTDNDTYAATNKDVQLLERQPMTVVKRVSDTGSQRTKLSQYFLLNQLVGWTRQQYAVDRENTTAPYNNSPAQTPRLQLMIANTQDNVQATCSCNVNITYYTECYGRLSLDNTT